MFQMIEKKVDNAVGLLIPLRYRFGDISLSAWLIIPLRCASGIVRLSLRTSLRLFLASLTIFLFAPAGCTHRVFEVFLDAGSGQS